MIKLIGYHGTSIDNAESILRENRFLPSIDNESLRMGEGAYFFSQIVEGSNYPIDCAREIVLYKHKKGKIQEGYGILSCCIYCSEEQYLDLFNPENLEMFHVLRYATYEAHRKCDPNFKYKNMSVADCAVFDILRKRKGLALIRCPQFFGMFPREDQILFEDKPRNPKTFVPNVINICADVELVKIDSIKLVEKGDF